MPTSTRGFARQIDPTRVCLMVLGIVFTSELLVMLLLPLLLPAGTTRSVEAVADASLLTIALLPFLWHTVIRPLRLVASLRLRLLEQFVNLQEEERRQIAYDLHDEVGQSLTSVLMGLRSLEDTVDREVWLRRLADLRGTISHAVQEVRRIANGLRPAALDHLGLHASLQRLAEDVSEKQQLRVSLSYELDTDGRLPSAVETAVYRIVQEALTNVVRHARASSATISLKVVGDQLQLEVQDDGQGLSVERAQRPANHGNHLGMAGMSERTALLDGQFSIQSRPGQGTRVLVTLPLQRLAP